MQVDAINTASCNYNFGEVSQIERKSTGSAESLFLQNKLEEIKDKQGVIGNIWNGFKETFDVGTTESECENLVQGYLNGSVSFEEAIQYLEDFDKKQTNMTDLAVNVITGIGGIATATVAAASGPIGWGVALASGAPTGALIKTGLKTLDRATNDIDGDALNLKQMAKDGITGALTGATSAITSGVGAGIRAKDFGLSVINGTKCGAICGGATGVVTYMTDVAFGDTDFDFGDLAMNTLSNTFVSGTVGAFVGGGMYGSASVIGTTGKQVATSVNKTIAKDSLASSLRKALAMEERNLLQA